MLLTLKILFSADSTEGVAENGPHEETDRTDGGDGNDGDA